MSETEKQPRGIFVLSAVEMWERFSYYGMRALLPLYLTAAIKDGGLGWSKETAGNLYGWYTGLVYLTPIIGGWIADRFLGTHLCLLIGGLLISAGHLTLAAETMPTLYMGLGLIVIGTGFFKSNCAAMVGQLYRPNDPRRDSGFTIYYMAVNLGALIAPIICGLLHDRFGWRWGFGAAGIAMVLGLIQYVYGRPKHLAGIGDRPAPAVEGKPETPSEPLTKEEKDRVLASLVVAFFVIFFWFAFEQSASSMSFFTEERVDRTLPSWLGWVVKTPEKGGSPMWPAEWAQSINPIFIVTLAPLFALMWTRLQRVGKDLSTPVKMSLGLIIVAAGFIPMVIAARIAHDGTKVSPLWLVLVLLIHTCAELCLSPVGLSLFSKLAPTKYLSAMMGTYYLANFFANLLAGKLAGLSDKIAKHGFIMPGLSGFFLIFVIAPGIAGLALFALNGWLKKRMHGRG